MKFESWQAFRQQARRLHRNAQTLEQWQRQIAKRYDRPIHTLDDLTPSAFAYEVAKLIAEYVVSEADRLSNTRGDTETRVKLRKERAAIRSSTDPIDKLIHERILLLSRSAKQES